MAFRGTQPVLTGWLARLLAGLAVAGLFLLGLEGVARLLPVDRWEQANPNVSYPVFVPGEGPLADRYVTNPHFLKSMSKQSFARVKPPGVKRIFVIGGSAALGWPGPTPAAFTGYLQRAYDAVAPGRFEVINAAAMSYGSHRVLDFLADIVALDPDLVVIWSGNNEYIESNAFSAYGRTAGMRGVQRVLRHSHLYRSIRLGLGAVAPALFAGPSGKDITDPRQAPQVRRGMYGRSADIDRTVLENYRANLHEMARVLAEHGVPGALCTVPVNLAEWVPDRQLPAIPDPEQARRWQELNRAALLAGEQGRFAEAATALDALLALTPRYAMGHYLQGVSLQQLGRAAEARAAFSRARDNDPRPIRALSAFEATIREVAANTGLALVDLEGAFAAASPAGVPGLNLFLDYVHPNEAGHKLVAVTVLEQAAGRLDPALPLPRLEQAIAGDDWLARNDFQRADMHYALGMTLFNNDDLDGAEQAYLMALREDPEYSEPAGNLAMIYEKRGDLAAARRYYEQSLRFDPGSMHAANLARVLYLQGDRAGARDLGNRLLSQGLVDVTLFTLLGDMARDDRRQAEALDFYRRAIAAGADASALQEKIAAVGGGRP